MSTAKVRPEKEAAVAELKEKFTRAKTVVLADNLGLSVARATKLRNELRAMGVEFKVAKNTMVRRALEDLGIEGFEPYLTGPTTFTFSYEDHTSGAKKLQDFFGKDRKPMLTVKAGLLDGKFIDAVSVKSLADIPPREVLLASILGGIQAPMAGVAGVLNAMLGSFAWALNARIQQVEGAEA